MVIPRSTYGHRGEHPTVIYGCTPTGDKQDLPTPAQSTCFPRPGGCLMKGSASSILLSGKTSWQATNL
jgi:hypothetical protein